MCHQRAQRDDESVRERGHALLAAHRLAAGQHDLEPPGQHVAVHLQQVGPPVGWPAPGAAASWRQPEAVAADPVKPAEIVEADHLRGGQPGQRLGAELLAQQPEVRRPAGNPSALLLHRDEHRARVGVRSQAGDVKQDRREGGEPADRAGHVQVSEHVAAMAFQVDPHPRAACPAVQRSDQRGQQQLVGVGAIRGARALQQVVGLGHGQAAGHRAGIGLQPAVTVRIARQGIRRTGERLRPRWNLVAQLGPGRVPVQGMRPLPERRAGQFGVRFAALQPGAGFRLAVAKETEGKFVRDSTRMRA